MATNILSEYQDLIKQNPLLTREQEIALAKKIKAGDNNARQKMIESNYRLVINIAKKYQGVDRILTKADVDEIKTAKVAIFVGTEYSSVNGRGEEGEPNRKTPWGELAFQIGGEKAFQQIGRAHV